MSQKTIKSHISTLRNRLKLHSDDSNFTDEYLYKTLTDARSMLIKRRTDKRNSLDPINWQTLCLPLVESQYHNCECVNVGCTVLKGTIKIPNIIMSRNKPLIKVVDFAGKTIPYTDELDIINNKYSKIKKNMATWTLIGDTFYLFNDLSRAMVMVRAIFQDPFDLANVSTCGDGNQACYDIDTESFPMDADLNLPMYKVCLEELGITLEVAPDTTNDSESNN